MKKANVLVCKFRQKKLRKVEGSQNSPRHIAGAQEMADEGMNPEEMLLKHFSYGENTQLSWLPFPNWPSLDTLA